MDVMQRAEEFLQRQRQADSIDEACELIQKLLKEIDRLEEKINRLTDPTPND